MPDLVEELTSVLRRLGAVPRLRPEAVTFSAVYDPVYRAAVIGLCMMGLGLKDPDGGLKVEDEKLRLYQFVAVHPHLLPSLRSWVGEHRQGRKPSLDGWAQFPRGYAADTVYDRVTTYLVAIGELQRQGTRDLRAALAPNGYLRSLLDGVQELNAFQAERHTITELGSLKITLRMLGR